MPQELTRAPRLESEPLYYRTDGPYGGSAPYFYDVEQLGWADRLRDNWRVVRGEYEAHLGRGADPLRDVFNPAGPKVPGWKSVSLQTYLWRFHDACRSFPLTVGLLDAIPGLTSAFINVLEPHARIPPHHGDSNAVVRFHLGLDVPPGDCAVRVGPETRRCANGTLLAFCDAHEHASWNATDGRRLVLVFDVMRPEYRDHLRWICANVVAATGVIWLEGRLRVVRRARARHLTASKTVPFPRSLRTALRRALAVGVHLWLPLQRRRQESPALDADAVSAPC